MRNYRSLLFTILLVTFLLCSCAREKPEIIVFVGAGMKEPFTEIAAQFEQETGIRVQTHFGGSSILRDYILEYKTGDIFLPEDKKNLEPLQQKGLVKDSAFMAWLVVVPLAAPYQVRNEIDAVLLTTAADPALAKKFYNYLRSKGKEVFQRHGYDTALPEQ